MPAAALNPINPGLIAVHNNLLFTMNYHPGYDARIPRPSPELRRWGSAPTLVDRCGNSIQPHDNAIRLRIAGCESVGNVSADFWNHASAFFLLPLLPEHHDASEVEVFWAMPRRRATMLHHAWRLRRAVPQWRQSSWVFRRNSSPGKSAPDRIDILIDLKLHTSNNSLMVFMPENRRARCRRPGLAIPAAPA